MSGTDFGLALAVFLACAVEGVEALTIVLAVGTTCGWRSTFIGIASAVVLLGAVTAALGPALTALPLNALRVVVGALLLICGLQLLRKAILRYSGLKATHDEEPIFAREREAAAAAGQAGAEFDPYSFTLAFKGVFLEGLEVIFIVLTFGANQHDVGLAAAAAGVAIAVVTLAGFAVRGPLARVPENTLKFGVGVMLTSFGMFWSGEGAGVHWPGDDSSRLGLIPGVLLFALAAVATIRRARAQTPLQGVIAQ